MHSLKSSRRRVTVVVAALVALMLAAVASAAGPAVVRSITAGFGLTGGGSGDVKLAVDPAVVQQRVSGSCVSGQAIRAIGDAGQVSCENVGSRVAGFVHRADAGTIPESDPGSTVIDNPLTNGDPTAIIVVTARLRGPGSSNIVDSHPLAVIYPTAATCPSCNPAVLDKWAIMNADSTVMTVGADFDVLVVKL